MDPESTKSALITIHRRSTTSAEPTGLPDYPGTRKLDQIQLEMISSTREENSMATKLFQCPVSSGEAQAPTAFMFGHHTSTKRPSSFQMKVLPFHQEQTTSKESPANSMGNCRPSSLAVQLSPRALPGSWNLCSPEPAISHPPESTPNLRCFILDESSTAAGKAAPQKTCPVGSTGNTEGGMKESAPYTASHASAAKQNAVDSSDSRDSKWNLVPATIPRAVRQKNAVSDSLSWQLLHQNSRSATPVDTSAERLNTGSESSQHTIAVPESIAIYGRKPEMLLGPPIHGVLRGIDNEQTDADRHIPQDTFEQDLSGMLMDTSNTAEDAEKHMQQVLQKQRKSSPAIHLGTSRSLKPTGINKHQQQGRRKPRPMAGSQFLAPTLASREPSAEDLLLLVMRRTRVKEQAEKQLVARQAELEISNRQLYERNEHHQIDLEEALIREKRCLVNLTVQQNELEVYSSRFNKLKAWAKDMSKDYEELRRESNAMKDRQLSLSAERLEMQEAIALMKSSFQKMAESLENLRIKIPGLREAMQPMEVALLAATTRLDDKDDQLCEAKSLRIRYESHVAELALVQKNYNREVIREQKNNSFCLKQVEKLLTDIIAGINNDPEKSHGMDQCLNLLETLSTRREIKLEDFRHMEKILGTILERLITYHKTMEDARASSDTAHHDVRGHFLGQITAVIDSLRPDISKREEVSRLQHDRTLLEQKVQESERVLQEVRRALEDANLREERVVKTHERIMTSLGDGNQDNLKAGVKGAEKVAEMMSQISIKHATLSGELASLNTRYTELSGLYEEEQVRARKSAEDLLLKEAAEQRLQEQLISSQSEHDETVQRLHRLCEESDALSSRAREREQETISRIDILESERDVLVQDLRNTREEMQSQAVLTEKTIQELTRQAIESEGIRAQLHQALKKSKDDKKIQIVQHDAIIKTQLAGKNDELQSLRAELETVVQMASVSSAETRESKEVQKEQNAKLEKSRHETDAAVQENIQTKLRVEGLLQVESELREELKSLPALHEDIETHLATISQLQARCVELDEVKTQNSALEKQNELLTGKLMYFEKKDEVIAHLEKQPSHNVEHLAGLERSYPAAAKFQHWEEVSKHKDYEVLELENKLAAAHRHTSTLAQLQQDCQTKDSEITVLRAKVAELEKDSPEIPESFQPNQYRIPENFLSQETILSLDQFAVSNCAAQREMSSATGFGISSPDMDHYPRTQRQVADRSAKNQDAQRYPTVELVKNVTRHTSLDLDSVQDSILVNASDPYSTQQTNRIPESQPDAFKEMTAINNTPKTVSSRSSLSDLENPFPSDLEGDDGFQDKEPGRFKISQHAKNSENPLHRRKEDEQGNQAPSSSHGEPMLLEDLEHPDDEEPPAALFAKRFRQDIRDTNKSESTHQAHHSSQGSQSRATSWIRPATAMNTGGGISSTILSCSEESALETSLTECTPSQANTTSSSPLGSMKERHQPNSAAKRRIEADMGLSATKGIKRLKRMPGDLERKKGSHKRSAKAAGTAIVPTRHDLPSGSRSVSTTGIDMPTIGTSQRTRTGRKSTRNERCSTRCS